MVARWPGAFLVSTCLHGAIVAAIVLVGWAVVEPDRPSRILSFVGDVAPAAEARVADSMPGLRVALPPVPARRATVEPPASVASDATSPAPQHLRSTNTAGARVPASPRPATVVSSQRGVATVASSPRRITKAEFDARQTGRSAPVAAAPHAARPHVDGTRIAEALKAEAGASRRGDGENAAATVGSDDYLGRLEAALGGAIERHPGLLDGLSAVAEYHILADGRLSRVRLLTRSGDTEFDRVLVATIEGYVAGPRPADVPEVHRTTFHTQAR